MFSSITDPSSTPIFEVLEIITNPEKNRLDATCAGRKCKIATDGLKVDFTERGIVLTKGRIQERSSSMGSCCSFH